MVFITCGVIAIVVSTVFLIFALTSCKPVAGSTETKAIQTVGMVGGTMVYIITDPETNIQYYVCDRPGGGTAICPRYSTIAGALYVED